MLKNVPYFPSDENFPFERPEKLRAGERGREDWKVGKIGLKFLG